VCSSDLNFPAPKPGSNALVIQNWNLARRIAHRYRDRCDVPYEDLEQLATVGLIYASRVYEPERGFAFSTCAYPYIRGRIQHYLRDHSHPVTFDFRWREKLPMAKRMLGNDGLSRETVADRLGMSMEDLDDMVSAMGAVGDFDENHGPLTTTAIDEADEIGGLLPLVAEAFEAMPGRDQKMILAWWEKPRQRPFPQQMLGVFHKRAGLLLKGVRVAEYRQLHLMPSEGHGEAPARPVTTRRPVRRVIRRSIAEVAAAAVAQAMLPLDCLDLGQ